MSTLGEKKANVLPMIYASTENEVSMTEKKIMQQIIGTHSKL